MIAPSVPYDVKGLLKTAVRDNDPVMCLEHKLLYATKGEVPEAEYLIPLGQADIKRPGKDVTLIAYSRQTLFALEAAQILAKEGIDAEVVDLRSLVPLDWDTIAQSVKKTHRAAILQEGPQRGGFAAEIGQQISEKLFDYLDAPVLRLAGKNVVAPFSPALEDVIFPHPQDVVRGIRDLIS